MTSSITVKHLKKAFGDNVVLNGVSFELNPGDALAVIGASGSGKSVLIKCILGLIPRDSGEIYIDGQDPTRLSARARKHLLQRTSMMFQGSALFDSLTVWENVAFGLMHIHKVPAREAKLVAQDILASVNLAKGVADIYPAELSGGMQRRVALARAIAMRPEIMFLDEPTTGLDPITAQTINQLMNSRIKELGASSIMITHDMASVRHVASRVALLYAGKIQWIGNVTEMDTTDNPYIQQFIHGEAKGPMTAG